MSFYTWKQDIYLHSFSTSFKHEGPSVFVCGMNMFLPKSINPCLGSGALVCNHQQHKMSSQETLFDSSCQVLCGT